MKISLLGGGTPKTALDGTELMPSEKADGSGNEHFSAAALRDYAQQGRGSAVPGAAYQFALADANGHKHFTSATNVALTLAADADVNFPLWTVLEFSQGDNGVVNLSAPAGVTIISRGNLYATAGKGAVAALKKVAANTWILTGDLA